MTAASAQRVEIAMCVDEGFAMPLSVALASLDAVSWGRPTRVSVLQPGFGADTKARITRGLRHLEVVWHDLDEDRVAGAHFPPQLSRATLYRLLLEQILPSDIERLIYLDGDIVVLDSLAPLFDAELGGRALGAVRDANSPWCAGICGPDWQRLGLAPDSPYFNAGILLIDLAAWRRERIGERALDVLRRQSPQWADQDALNIILEGRWTELPRRWNLQTADVSGNSTGWAVFGDDTRAATADPAVIHYSGIGQPKPWQLGCAHPALATWLEWLDRSAWSGWRPPREPALDRWARAAVRTVRRARHAQRGGLPT